jgi:hypothetical protein
VLDRHKYEKAVAFLSETGNGSSTNEFPLGGLRSPLVVSWPALSTLEAIGLLDWALEQIPDLYVSPLTVQDLNADATEEALYEEALSLVSRIEQELDRKDGIFLVVAGSQSEPHGAPSWQPDMGIALAKGVALWTDDLVIRMLHVHGTTGARAFSTRCLIESLGESGVVGDDQQHQLTLDLMRIGFDYCWFKAETLVWSARQHNYRSNDDTEALIAHRGSPDSFDNVAAQAIALLAESYDARREPRLDELGHWMRHLSNATAEGWAFITERFIVRVTQLLSRRSRGVQLRWMTLVKNWTDLGRIRPQRGRIQVVSLSPPIWRPDQGTWQ